MTGDVDIRSSGRAENDGSESNGDDLPVEDGEGEPRRSNRPLNVKRDWSGRSFYFPDRLVDELSISFKRLSLQLAESETDLSLKKTRHYYPLVVELGLERLRELNEREIRERIERRERDVRSDGSEE